MNSDVNTGNVVELTGQDSNSSRLPDPPRDTKPLKIAFGVAIAVIALVAGISVYVLTRPKAAPMPAPTPVVNSDDAKASRSSIDSALRSFDASQAAVKSGLEDTQGNLSQ